MTRAYLSIIVDHDIVRGRERGRGRVQGGGPIDLLDMLITPLRGSGRV